MPTDQVDKVAKELLKIKESIETMIEACEEWCRLKAQEQNKTKRGSMTKRDAYVLYASDYLANQLTILGKIHEEKNGKVLRNSQFGALVVLLMHMHSTTLHAFVKHRGKKGGLLISNQGKRRGQVTSRRIGPWVPKTSLFLSFGP